jgi:osomolarity two-component system sensor histidine kinase NIK1
MDLSMPIMGGHEATQIIRKFERENGLERLPIVALTAHAMLGDREKCIEVGMGTRRAPRLPLVTWTLMPFPRADEYLTKPLRKPDLLATINKVVLQVRRRHISLLRLLRQCSPARRLPLQRRAGPSPATSVFLSHP